MEATNQTLISIKRIGFNRGTCGWLKSNLENKKLKIQEGISKSNKLALYLDEYEGDKRISNMCIAIYNPWNLTRAECNAPGIEEYYPLEINGMAADKGATLDEYNLTPAATKIVHNIAQSWCDLKNQEKENDKPDYKVIVNFE